MGRTDWDRGITHILSKGRKYYVCNEALRDTFYMNDKMWKPHKRKNMLYLPLVVVVCGRVLMSS